MEAEGVVDEPERVDVDVDEGDPGAGPARPRERQGQVLLQQRAVREAGQGVAEGQLEAALTLGRELPAQLGDLQPGRVEFVRDLLSHPSLIGGWEARLEAA